MVSCRAHLDAGPLMLWADAGLRDDDGRERERERKRDCADEGREEDRVLAADAGRDEGLETVSLKRSETALLTCVRKSRRVAYGLATLLAAPLLDDMSLLVVDPASIRSSCSRS
jgi:hypothetical protein